MVSRQHIEKYLDDELTRVERHEFERRMLEDPFLSDAIEGLQLIKDPGERVVILDDLERQMIETMERVAMEASKRRNWTIAASVSIVLISLAAYFGIRSIRTDNSPLAQQVEQAVAQDSLESKVIFWQLLHTAFQPFQVTFCFILVNRMPGLVRFHMIVHK